MPSSLDRAELARDVFGPEPERVGECPQFFAIHIVARAIGPEAAALVAEAGSRCYHRRAVLESDLKSQYIS
jgi:hypothetical protein